MNETAKVYRNDNGSDAEFLLTLNTREFRAFKKGVSTLARAGVHYSDAVKQLVTASRARRNW